LTKEKPKKKRRPPPAPKPTKASAADIDSPTGKMASKMNSVDQSVASKGYTGGCLDEENYNSIKLITCKSLFQELEQDFEEEYAFFPGAAFPNLKHM
jgi:hypothetical protein